MVGRREEEMEEIFPEPLDIDEECGYKTAESSHLLFIRNAYAYE